MPRKRKKTVVTEVEEKKPSKKDTVITAEKTSAVKESKTPESRPQPVKETKAAENKISIDTSPDKNPEPEVKTPPAAVKAETNSSVYFTVQIGASTNPQKDSLKYAKTSGAKGIKCADGYTRYVVGNFNTIEGARQRQAQLKNNGFKDSFITAFKGNEKISVTEAEQMLKTP